MHCIEYNEPTKVCLFAERIMKASNIRNDLLKKALQMRVNSIIPMYQDSVACVTVYIERTSVNKWRYIENINTTIPFLFRSTEFKIVEVGIPCTGYDENMKVVLYAEKVFAERNNIKDVLKRAKRMPVKSNFLIYRDKSSNTLLFIERVNDNKWRFIKTMNSRDAYTFESSEFGIRKE